MEAKCRPLNYFVTPSPEILDFLGAPLGVGFSAMLIESVSSVPYTFWRPQSYIKEFILNPTNFIVICCILSFYEENKIEVICCPIWRKDNFAVLSSNFLFEISLVMI